MAKENTRVLQKWIPSHTTFTQKYLRVVHLQCEQSLALAWIVPRTMQTSKPPSEATRGFPACHHEGTSSRRRQAGPIRPAQLKGVHA